MTTKKLNAAENMTLPIHAPNVAKPTKEAVKEKLADLMKEELRMVKGTFQCFETPGASVKISVRKYPGVPPFEKIMSDGMQYEIPLYVARHLNGVDVMAGAMTNNPNPMIGSCSYPVHGFNWQSGQEAPASAGGEIGVPVPLIGISKRVKRFGFQSMEFGAPLE